MTMQLIETKTLGTATSAIEFTSIPQTFTDLVILCSLRTNRALEIDPVVIRFNSSTTNYTRRNLEGDGSAVASTTPTDGRAGDATAALATANTFSNFSCYVPNYAGSTNKSASVDSVTEDNITFARQTIQALLWSDTSAITSIQALPLFGTEFVANCSISLYGILKGSDGIVTTS
jgi:hypothetical protein